MSSVLLVAAAFVACAVEMVEALTIVLAVGVTRGWRSTLLGAVAAVIALGAVVGALGPAVAHLPIDSLRLVVGALLLVFGLQWLRKAILRAGGVKALHDEDKIYEAQRRAAASATATHTAVDWYSFTVAFKGVFLEGLEVAFIVVTFGGAQHDVGLAVIGAAAAFLAVLAAGLALHRPLSAIPENTMKFAVGAMLTTFGLFWAGEGAGVAWPGGDVALFVLLPVVVAGSLGLVWSLRSAQPTALAEVPG
jgi:uncharacterized membrane protein